MGPALPETTQMERKAMEDHPVAIGELSDDDGFAELFGIGPGGLAGAVEEENVALKQLNRLERVIAGDNVSTGSSQGREQQLVGGNGEWSAVDPEVLSLARLLAAGKYLEVLGASKAASWLLQDAVIEEKGSHIADVIGARVVAYVCGDGGDEAPLWRAATALWVGVASLNLHLQANYTGPTLEVTPSLTSFVTPLQALAGSPRWGLEADGETPYSQSVLPELLSLARAVLHPLALPGIMPWSTPVQLSADGQAQLASISQTPSFHSCVAALESPKLWAGRAVVTHRRLFSGRHPSPGLWAEAQALFVPLTKSLPTLPDNDQSKSRAAAACGDTWATRVWLEWGLAQHHLEEANRGKEAFKKAVTASGLQLTLTAAMGRRTKFQQMDLAQMVLLAKPARSAKGNQGEEEQQQQQEEEEERKEAPGVALPSAAVHPTDSVRLETVAYSDPQSLQQQEGGRTDTLTPLEQAVILALCLDIANNNPKDGLTTEEMMPYVERVLQTPANWMVYSTGLLERSWLDFESPYGRERAVLQMQALVDQHGTRLTLTQASSDVIANAAPAEERLQYVHCIAYPPQWELKRGLADRYAKLGVFASAADMYTELEQWDEVVQCYRVLERLAKAEALVRERLQVAETPAMWVALGDLTQDSECYRKAWELSGGRYARAKRSLGRMAFRNKNLEEAVGHFEQAVAIMPLVPETWFLMGIACMSLERWEQAASAFTRVVQQEPDDGRAWGNLGAIHTKAGNYAKALAAFKEGVRHHRDSEHMWENYLICATKLEQYFDIIAAFQRLLDLRQQHQAGNKWTIDVAILDFLVHRTAVEPLKDGDQDDRTRALLQKRVAELLGRSTSVTSTDGKLWGVYATFNEALGRWDQALDCRVKACRTLINKSQWTKDEAGVDSVAEALEALATAYLKVPTSMGLQQCLLFLRSPMQKLSVEPWEGTPQQERVRKVFQSVEEELARLKAGTQEQKQSESTATTTTTT